MTGFRGSSSAQASEYKLQGHADEQLFCDLIQGFVKTDNKTGKADVIGPDQKIYSVKGANKKWQIFLYGYDRFKKDKDFQDLNGVGDLLLASLDCFPVDYDLYLRDKVICKNILNDYCNKNPQEKAVKNLDTLKLMLPVNNFYFSSKLNLELNTDKLISKLSDSSILRRFLDKAIFNMAEVDRIAIKKGKKFLIFEKPDVLDIFVENFIIEKSKAGNRRTDLNIAGQKVLMKNDTNIVELEIRNDSPIHYRQVRFNMLREKALDLLLSQSQKHLELNENILIYKRI